MQYYKTHGIKFSIWCRVKKGMVKTVTSSYTIRFVLANIWSNIDKDSGETDRVHVQFMIVVCPLAAYFWHLQKWTHGVTRAESMCVETQ